jgi:hypothetical protein
MRNDAKVSAIPARRNARDPLSPKAVWRSCAIL